MSVNSIFAEGAIFWTSRLQKTTALTTEAEIIVASEGVKELVWLKRLQTELWSDFARKTPILYIDNASAFKLTKNPKYHKSSKHTEAREGKIP
jgi:hypothetical protein